VKLIVGLGNPGRRHSQNRHNAGYQCLERIAQRHDMTMGKVMFKAYVARGQIGDYKVVLAKPLTFMNLSGLAVRPLLRWYHLALDDLLVIVDDLDLPLGSIRLRQKGGSAGHKGMRSIIQALGGQDFPRLRIGIGRPLHGQPESYVLSDFTSDEWALMEGAFDRALAAVECFVTEGIAVAMNKANASPDGRRDGASPDGRRDGASPDGRRDGASPDGPRELDRTEVAP
jgi:PTH1 family peptidyl-tRNA hydrolase